MPLDQTKDDHLNALKKLQAAPLLPFSSTLRRQLPAEGGIYHIIQVLPEGQRSIYVGETGSLKRRINDMHYKQSQNESALRKRLLITSVCSDEAAVTAFLETCHVQYIKVPDDAERLKLERFIIDSIRPEFNKR